MPKPKPLWGISGISSRGGRFIINLIVLSNHKRENRQLIYKIFHSVNIDKEVIDRNFQRENTHKMFKPSRFSGKEFPLVGFAFIQPIKYFFIVKKFLSLLPVAFFYFPQLKHFGCRIEAQLLHTFSASGVSAKHKSNFGCHWPLHVWSYWVPLAYVSSCTQFNLCSIFWSWGFAELKHISTNAHHSFPLNRLMCKHSIHKWCYVRNYGYRQNWR